MATSEGIPSSIDIEFLELNDNPYIIFFLHVTPKVMPDTNTNRGMWKLYIMLVVIASTEELSKGVISPTGVYILVTCPKTTNNMPKNLIISSSGILPL